MILTDEQVKEIQRRNNVERPTFYGATLENLTETAIALRAQLAELAASEVQLREVPSAHDAPPELNDIPPMHIAIGACVATKKSIAAAIDALVPNAGGEQGG